jgi:hypothetical protein
MYILIIDVKSLYYNYINYNGQFLIFHIGTFMSWTLNTFTNPFTANINNLGI